jgi:hypothetical protein
MAFPGRGLSTRCVCYPLSVRLSALLPHMCGSLAMSRAATSAQCHRDCFVRPLTGATRPSFVAVQTTRISSFNPYFKPDSFLSHPLHPSPHCPIFHLHPHLLALSSSLPISSSTRAHASCIELRPPRLSAPAAASQPTTYEPTPIPSSIRTPSAMLPRLPLRLRHPSMQHATTSDFPAFPLKQQLLSRPFGIGLSTSSAASICAWISC